MYPRGLAPAGADPWEYPKPLYKGERRRKPIQRMTKVEIADALMLVDTRRMSFDMREIENRRFMFSTQTGELILGKQYKGRQLYKSHAEEHFDSGAKAPFDSFIRGWIGTGKDYKNGVIHFAPSIDNRSMELFDKAFSTLQMFSENGANGNTVVRGFGNTWEQPLNNIIPRSEERSEKSMSYHAYDHDKLEAADTMRIERKIYFESENADISTLTALPLEQLQAMREESAAAEQAVFESLQTQAAAWEEQAGKTLAFDKAIEYARTPETQHTANKWQAEEYRHVISNRVFQMDYNTYERTLYDKAAQKSVPYRWELTWTVRTNSPAGHQQAKIAGQHSKVFSDKAAMEKYLNGRIKAYAHLFTEISPPIPQEYAQRFKVNGQLLSGYTIEGEQPKQEQQIGRPIPEKPGQRKEREALDGQFSILIDNRSRFETGEAGGAWLSMPATKEQLHEAMKSVGVTADNPQDFFINGYSTKWDHHFALPHDVVCAASVDELNFLAARLEALDPAEIGKLNAALQSPAGFESVGQMIDFTYNVDYLVHIEARTPQELGDYYLNKSGMVQMPEEWKGGVDLAAFGENAAEQEQGLFTEYGYIMKSGDEWERQFEGREVPEEYHIMSYPQPETPTRLDPEKVDMDAISTRQAATLTAEPPQPRPVVPIVLSSEKPAEKMKEITDRLEQGIQAIFDSDRYKEYLRVMSKFHDYSLNNTILIAMQKPDASLVAGFSAWKNKFERNVKKGEKGIKIIAPSPFKIKQEMEKIDPHTQKPVIGGDGKPITEEREITIPAYKVVSVFDVSQTDGKELPDISAENLVADVEQYDDFWGALESASPVPIAFEQIEGGANGYYSLEDKRIAIQEGESQLQVLKTAIHEIAHARLHDIDLNAPKDEQNRVDRRTREVEAESVAYAVCQHFGLDTSEYSFAYVAGWSSGKEMSELKSSLETIQAAAKELITEIKGHFTDLQQQRGEVEQQRETAEPQHAADQSAQQQDTFSIYQLKSGDETRDLRFEPYDRLQAAGLCVNPANYEHTYTAPFENGMTLESIYERFNIDRPADFKGHSLSVSDIVVLHQNGQDTAHYVDSIGYRDAPEFLKEPQKALAPDDLITDESIKTPRGSFRVTDMTREQIEAAGYGFHHQSDDGKYLIMANGTLAFAVAAQQPEKVNPLKHIEDAVEQNDNNFDGIINNTPQTPTVAELEQRAKAGEAISLTDLAKAVKAEKREQPPKKRSILKQLDEYKKQAKAQPPKQQQREQKKDREV